MYICKVINKVTKTVNVASNASGTTTSTGLSFSEYQTIANQVIEGRWGYGDDRRTALENAGYNYAAVMTIVNHELVGTAINMELFNGSSGTDYSSLSAGEQTVTENEEHVFHYPPSNSKASMVLSGRISDEMNRAGTFEFQLPPENACLKAGYFKKLSSIIEVYWDYDTTPLFRGRIIDSQKAFAGTMNFRCEGWMSVLNDSIVGPQANGNEEEGVTDTVEGFFCGLIGQHNEKMGTGSDKILSPAVVRGFSDAQVHFPWPNYEKTFEYLQNNFLGNENVGGRMWIETFSDGHTAIHLDADDASLTTQSKQSIIFGKNLIDLSETIDATELYTVILPTGKDGLKLSGTGYIENAAGISKYGRIWHHEEFSDIDNESDLRTKATELLNRSAGEVTSIEVSAVDLHLTDYEIPNIKVGEYVPVLSPSHGIDVAYICTAVSIDICNPANTKYTLGVNPDTLTTKQLKLSQKITQSNLSYKSEATTRTLTATVYDGRVEVQSISFYKTGKTVYLSFVAKFLKVVADADPTILKYDTEVNPTTEATSTAYDQTTRKNYTARSYGGNIQVINNSEINVNDIVSCTITWRAR